VVQQLEAKPRPFWRRRRAPVALASAVVCALFALSAHTTTVRVVDLALACFVLCRAVAYWIVPEPADYEAKEAALRARREAMGITKPWHHVALWVLIALAIALPLLFVATTRSKSPCGCPHTVTVPHSR
jgi:4-amino-4-deoxy-L-arabinose transferase-like glycosyltransferase